MGLLVVRRVHEVIAVAIGVKELHFDFVHVYLFDGIRRTKPVFEHGSGTQVAQLGLNKSAQVTGRAVFYAENGVQIIVVLDDHAGTKLGGRDRHRLKKSPCTIAVQRRRKTGRPQVPPTRGLKDYFTLRCAVKETFSMPNSSKMSAISPYG